MTEVTVVDVHAHAMPLPLMEWLQSEGLADLSRLGENIVVVDPRVSGVAPGAPLPLPPGMHDNAVRLAQMDEAGVSHHAISLPPFLMGSTCEDGDLVAELVRRGNDSLAELVSGEPDRLLALGGVPVGWTGVEDEARRCLDDLGMAGIAIGSRGGGKDLDHEVNAQLWALLSERKTFTFMHPSGVPDPKRMKDYWFPQLVGYPMETAIATARLAFSGVIENQPFPLCLAHGGGCLPSLRGRLDMGWDRKPVAHTTKVPPSEIFNRLYYDTATFNTDILARLIEDVGVDHVLSGTDYPFDLADWDPAGTVAALSLSDAEKKTILAGTASKLLGLG